MTENYITNNDDLIIGELYSLYVYDQKPERIHLIFDIVLYLGFFDNLYTFSCEKAKNKKCYINKHNKKNYCFKKII
jgi:hypothetical protein